MAVRFVGGAIPLHPGKQNEYVLIIGQVVFSQRDLCIELEVLI